MATSIGNLSVVLSASATQLKTGLDAAKSHVASFANSAASMLSGAFLPLVGGLTMGGIVAKLKSTSDDILAMAKDASRFGISIGAMAGLMKAAGGDSEALKTSMGRLANVLGDVASGSDEAKKKFAELGLDGEKLAKQSLDVSLLQIADKIQSLPTAAQRAHAAFQLMGRGALELVPFLQKGSDAIQRMGEAQYKAYSQITAQDVANLKHAKKILEEKVESRFATAWNNTVVMIAGAIDELVYLGGGSTTPIPKSAKANDADLKAFSLKAQVDDLTKSLKEQNDAYLLNADAAKIAKLAKDGAAATDVQRLDALRGEKEYLQRIAAIKNEFADSKKHSFDGLKDQLSEFDLMLQSHLLTWKEYQFIVQKTFDQAAASVKINNLPTSGAALFDSREAYSAMVARENQNVAESSNQPAQILIRLEKREEHAARQRDELIRELRKGGKLAIANVN